MASNYKELKENKVRSNLRSDLATLPRHSFPTGKGHIHTLSTR